MSEQPTKEQIIAAISNMASNMQTVAILLDRYGEHEHAKELNGAATMAHSWYRDLKEHHNFLFYDRYGFANVTDYCNRCRGEDDLDE